jgi:hypothetical protein
MKRRSSRSAAHPEQRRQGSAMPESMDPPPQDPREVGEPPPFPLLGDLARDSAEALAISLCRFVMAGYCSGSLDAWERGFGVAEEALGTGHGPRFFALVLSAGRALKAERIGMFRFMPGYCRHICEDEEELLAALQAARRPDAMRFDAALDVLARQGRSERLGAALRDLAMAINSLTAEALSGFPEEAPPAGSRLH